MKPLGEGSGPSARYDEGGDVPNSADALEQLVLFGEEAAIDCQQEEGQRRCLVSRKVWLRVTCDVSRRVTPLPVSRKV
jgi:hypothetical protein